MRWGARNRDLKSRFLAPTRMHVLCGVLFHVANYVSNVQKSAGPFVTNCAKYAVHVRYGRGLRGCYRMVTTTVENSRSRKTRLDFTPEFGFVTISLFPLQLEMTAVTVADARNLLCFLVAFLFFSTSHKSFHHGVFIVVHLSYGGRYGD